MNGSKTINVISGTHWDREWRYTAEQSLLRLAILVDRLIDILEKDEAYACFHLDGGTVVIEDYLAVRPENEARLRKLMQQGRIFTVPWYTLPEMSTVSPEALIRNLLIGIQMGHQFGGLMKTGYTATSYGQISQLPQIYAGFGIDTAMSYRGTNKHQVPPISLWESPDGTQIYHIRCFDEVTRTNWFFFTHYELVLGKAPRDLRTEWKPEDWPVHMADSVLFETSFQLKNERFEFNADPAAQKKAIEHLARQAMPQAIGNHLLALDMEDNASPYHKLPELIKAINAAQSDYKVKQSSLDEFVEIAKSSVKKNELSALKGEMRYTAVEAGFNCLLGATHSSRVQLKLMNDESQVELINVAEPLSSMCGMLGGSYEHTLLNRAWLDLLKNHAHDSICGAAIDAAHLENPTRFRTVMSLSRECSRKAVEDMWTKLDTSSAFNDGDLTITLFNTLPFARNGVQPVIIDVPHITFGNFVIEQCTGAGPIIEGFDPDQMVTYDYFDIVDEQGNKIANKLIEREKTQIEVERLLDSNAAAYDIIRNRILMEVDIPAMGYRTYALRPRKRSYITNPTPGTDRKMIARSEGVLENEHLLVTINNNGTFEMLDKATGRAYTDMHYFCDNSSIGSAHQHKTSLRDYTITSLGTIAEITLQEDNALRATWQIDIKLRIPSGVQLDGTNRSEHKIEFPISTLLTLKKGARRLEIKTIVQNSARDHRLRVLFPTNINTDFAYASGPFDVIKRKIQWLVTGDNMESHHPFQPMQDFVTVSDDKVGLSFMSKGLGEYEVIDDSRRTLAITLLRTHRAYMLANRGAKTPEEFSRQQGQHCLGTFEFNYALYPHKENWSSANVIAEAQDFKIPYRIIQGVPKQGQLPATQSLLTINPSQHIHVSAFYRQTDGKGYILRLWNSSSQAVKANIKTSLPITSAQSVHLDETVIEPVMVKDGVLSLNIRPHKIETLCLEI
ncbi:MAG: glycoside hydrolase family 38 C-terminal domain-containing protein [Phycisphaerae bacterium]